MTKIRIGALTEWYREREREREREKVEQLLKK